MSRPTSNVPSATNVGRTISTNLRALSSTLAWAFFCHLYGYCCGYRPRCVTAGMPRISPCIAVRRRSLKAAAYRPRWPRPGHPERSRIRRGSRLRSFDSGFPDYRIAQETLPTRRGMLPILQYLALWPLPERTLFRGRSRTVHTPQRFERERCWSNRLRGGPPRHGGPQIRAERDPKSPVERPGHCGAHRPRAGCRQVRSAGKMESY
jgi:hypothetical protein